MGAPGPQTFPHAEPAALVGPAGRLEARIEVPADERGHAVAVICHPHPLHGGSMDNKVVHTLARTCHRLGVPTVRFNFRGVGASEGEHDEGRGERQDALTACAHARERWPGRALWLMGFSFGAGIAILTARAAGAKRLVTVAPPVQRMALEWEHPDPPPWLIVAGDADEIVAFDELETWAKGLPAGPQLVVLAGAGHFFHGRLNDLGSAVIDFLTTPRGAPAAR